jgi:selenocysteine lyase/cysteine desulfurase
MNWTRLRGFFPAAREAVYLDHLALAPVSTRVQEALDRHAYECAHPGSLEASRLFGAERERVRARAAALLHSPAEAIALVRDARDGLAALLTGWDWKRGDILVYHGFDAARLPGRDHLHERGVELRRAMPPHRPLDLDALTDALAAPGARLLLLPSIDPRDASRIDLVDVASRCRERGVLLAVDASASLGALPERPAEAGIDFLVADGHRRMASTRGAGLLYCDTPLRDALRASGAATGTGRGARRLDTLPTHAPSVAALGAAIDLWLELGTSRIGQRVVELAAYLAHGLAARGLTLRSSRTAARASGIVLFAPPAGVEAETLQRELAARKLHIGCHGGWLRATPHCYNSESELDELVEAL